MNVTKIKVEKRGRYFFALLVGLGVLGSAVHVAPSESGELVEGENGSRRVMEREGMRAEVTVGGLEVDRKFGPRFDRTLRVSSWQAGETQVLTFPGLVSEFGLRGEGVLGFDEVGKGGHFLKIGVGVCERTDDRPYSFSRRYPVLDSGSLWVEKADADGVVARWLSPELRGYRVELIKRVRWSEEGLEIETELVNRGKQAISFEEYNHHFLMPGENPVGSEIEIRTGFPIRAEKPHAFVEVKEQGLQLNQQLPQSRSAYIQSKLPFPAARNRVQVLQNGEPWMEIGGDFDASHFEFFALREALCPEVFLQRTLPPGERTRWNRSWKLLTGKTADEE